jgi:hypothetical protein
VSDESDEDQSDKILEVEMGDDGLSKLVRTYHDGNEKPGSMDEKTEKNWTVSGIS